MHWQKFDAEADIDAALQRSFHQPVLLFKHSHRCSISAAALGRLERTHESWSPHCTAFLVDVVGQRPISNALASRLAVPHESPQVLLINKGVCSYHESHFGIQAATLLEHLTDCHNGY
jgi:bacillithiol system protein YtxJ